MDPNANLQEQLALAQRMLKRIENGQTPLSTDVYRLSELVLALDEWITRGGFIPERWVNERT